VTVLPETSTDGVPAPAMSGEQVVARWDDVDLLLISNASTAEQRGFAERVARRAMSDTPFHTPAYSIEDQDPETRIFVARRAGRAIGLAVLRPRPRWAWWSWDDWEDERRPATGVAPLPSWTVETIWTLAQAQQRGLAQRLLEQASRVVDQPVTSFGWRRPFTPSGEAFVRRMCPEGFWVPD
jgi:GNAT superfamily N-acetyltransferase